MTGMLASVSSLDEAHIVADAGADIIDLKQPAQGALGALPHHNVQEIVTTLGANAVLSATVGDLPMQPAVLNSAIKTMAVTGVDYVKVGLFASTERRTCIASLRTMTAQGIKVVMVLFADQQPDFSLLPAIAAAGCVGAMLDTATKQQGRLTDCLNPSQLAEFVNQSQSLNLITGLAGSLQADDIDSLLPLGADYLGFRGALCRGSQRTASLDTKAVTYIRALIPQAIPNQLFTGPTAEAITH